MLRLPKSLLFPTLEKQGKVQFKNSPSPLKTTIYKVNWSKIEEIKHERWKDQLNVNPPPRPFCGTLPDNLKSMIDNMQFALSEDYLQEIRHCSMKAAEEWDRKRPIAKHGMDPAVGPVISYVDTSFHLLADCLYDSETNYFSRSGIKLIAPYIFIYRFWSHQTTYGNVMTWVNLPQLQMLLEDLKKEDKETYTIGTQICTDLQNHSKLIESAYQTHKEEVKPAINEVFEDLLSNKVASVTVKDLSINIPELGKLNLIYPIRLRRSKGKITLKAEFKCNNMQKVLQDIPNYSNSFDFHIQKDEKIFCAKESIIKSISANPPPEITIEISKIILADNKSHEGEVKKIDLQRIKTVKNQEINAIDQAE